jgi:hypothetical protein
MEQESTENGMELHKKYTFKKIVEINSYLSEIREEYSEESAENRRCAADYQYYQEIASNMFNDALLSQGQKKKFQDDYWPSGVLSLAVDPL